MIICNVYFQKETVAIQGPPLMEYVMGQTSPIRRLFCLHVRKATRCTARTSGSVVMTARGMGYFRRVSVSL